MKGHVVECAKFLGFATVDIIGDVLGAIVLLIADIVGDVIVSILTAATDISNDLHTNIDRIKK